MNSSAGRIVVASVVAHKRFEDEALGTAVIEIALTLAVSLLSSALKTCERSVPLEASIVVVLPAPPFRSPVLTKVNKVRVLASMHAYIIVLFSSRMV